MRSRCSGRCSVSARRLTERHARRRPRVTDENDKPLAAAVLEIGHEKNLTGSKNVELTAGENRRLDVEIG